MADEKSQELAKEHYRGDEEISDSTARKTSTSADDSIKEHSKIILRLASAREEGDDDDDDNVPHNGNETPATTTPGMADKTRTHASSSSCDSSGNNSTHPKPSGMNGTGAEHRSSSSSTVGASIPGAFAHSVTPLIQQEQGQPLSSMTSAPGEFEQEQEQALIRENSSNRGERYGATRSGTENEKGNSSCFLVKAEEVLVHDEEEAAVHQEWKDRASELQEKLSSAPIAQILHVEENTVGWAPKRRLLLLLGLLLVLAGIVTAVVLTTASSDDATEPESTSKSPPILPPTLDIIQKRGTLKCRGTVADIESGHGFSVDMCRAIAAALLHDPNKAEFVPMPHSEQFQALFNGTVDLATDTTALTAERDLFVEGGMTFTRPFLYTGTVFVGVPEYVDCADRNDVFTGECRNVRVCVVNESVQASLLHEVLEGADTLEVQTLGAMFGAIAEDDCNVAFTSALLGNQKSLEDANYTGPFKMSEKLYSKVPCGLASRASDPVFADMVNWIFQAMVKAEALNITKATAHEFPTTDLFGPEYFDMFQRAIAVTGNFGEIYENHFEERIPRQAINTLYLPENEDNNGGLLYPMRLGRVDPEIDWAISPPLTLKPESRGYLRCGIRSGRLGLAHWNATVSMFLGIDVDQCVGLAAALFAGDTSKLELVEYTSMEDAFSGLVDEEIDVLAGAEYSMVNDVMEPTTGQGFAFGIIYYYAENNDTEKEMVPLAMASKQDDNYWSDYVNFISNGPLHAEDNDITQATAGRMPVVEVFGPRHRQGLRDAILSVGNFAEQYARNMEKYVPRQNNTRNNLNMGGPMFYADYLF